MSSPVQYKYSIASKTAECTEPPKDPKKDPCQIDIYKSNQEVDFTLSRKDKKFVVAAKDEARIKKEYPSYAPPQQKLQDYLVTKKNFFKTFGENGAPSSFTKNIRILSEGQVFLALDQVANFIAHGNLRPKEKAQKTILMATILNSIAAYADPSFGKAIEQALKDFSSNKKLSQGARNRVNWLQSIYQVRQIFWDQMGPLMGKSQLLSQQLKSSSQEIISFLIANHILADQGFKVGLFTDRVISAAEKHHEILSQIGTNYDVSKNFYQYMADILEKVKKGVNLPLHLRADFNSRIEIAIENFRKEAVEETKRLLPKEKPATAFKLSLLLKYGDKAKRRKVLKLILPHIDIHTQKSQPGFTVKMASIETALRKWIKNLPEADKGGGLKSIAYILDQLFERGEKMDAFYGGKWKKVGSFFDSKNFGKGMFGGNNNLILQDLITWARGETKKRRLPISPDANPHVHLRKWSLGTELGVGVLGLGTFFIPYGDPDADLYTHGASAILMGSGFGAAAGNTLSYALDFNGDGIWFDIVGAVVGGLAGGLIYGLTTSKPEIMGGPPMQDPGHRNPVDPYGP